MRQLGHCNTPGANGAAGLSARAVLPMLLSMYTLPADAQIQQALDDLVGSFVSQNLARNIVLADSELITLGIMDFDPNEFVDLGNIEAGSSESLELRSQLGVYSFPWRFERHHINDKLSRHAQFGFAYITSNQELSLDAESVPSPLDEQSFMISGNDTWRYQLTPGWQLSAGVGAVLMRYENDFEYRDPLLQAIRPVLEGTFFNTAYNAWLLDPELLATYSREKEHYKWQYRLRYRYAFGETFATDDPSQDARIDVGRLNNSLVLFRDGPVVLERPSAFKFLASRIDITADATEPMATDHYYELQAGWVFDTSQQFSLLRNIGLGLSFNIGSNLSGGSVVVLFNEEI